MAIKYSMVNCVCIASMYLYFKLSLCFIHAQILYGQIDIHKWFLVLVFCKTLGHSIHPSQRLKFTWIVKGSSLNISHSISGCMLQWYTAIDIHVYMYTAHWTSSVSTYIYLEINMCSKLGLTSYWRFCYWYSTEEPILLSHPVLPGHHWIYFEQMKQYGRLFLQS